MINKYIIKFILLFKSVFIKFGIDPYQLQIILSTKLKMDDRRPNMYNQYKGKKKKETKNASLLVMFFLAIMGLFITVFLAFFKQPFLGHTMFFSVFMVMLAFTLISDFTSVLIDTKDNYIILPRPVNDKTFSVARILHIGIHISKMAFAIAFFGIIYSFVFEGVISGLVFLLETLIATVLSIFLVNITYLIVLKITSPQKFKDFISYFQIAFSVLIFVAYYILPKLISKSVIDQIEVENISLIGFVPSFWLASLHEVAVNFKNTSLTTGLYATLAVLAPVISLYLVVKVLAKGFNQKLSSISSSGSDAENSSTEVKVPTSGIMNKIAKLIAPDPIENAGFKISWMLSARYRDFKVKVYPSFAFVPVYFVYFGFIGKRGNIAESWENLMQGNMYILLLYLSSFVLTSVLQNISMTDKYKAAWIYFTTPHQQPGKVLGGMFKAVIVKYYLPFYIIITIFSISFWGITVINDVILSFMIGIIYGILVALFQVKGLPFSQPMVAAKGGKAFLSLLIMAIPVALGFLHNFAVKWEIVIWIAALIMTAVAWVSFNHYRKETWESLELID
jgi:ABC-2 type transport system permease protein